MNLYGMLVKKDRNLLVTGGEVTLAKGVIGEDTWRGLRLLAGATLRLTDVRRFASFRGWPQQCGWMAECIRSATLKITFLRSGTDEVLHEGCISGAFQPVLLPWPKEALGKVDLLISAHGKSGSSVFLANHKALSRQWLIGAAVGTGIEIGPGPQPQILPGPNVEIAYLEQMAPEEWNRLYNRGGKYPVRTELWENYIVGDAWDLPVEDTSQDFLFASHVFEHLVNPIGHLSRWRAKLKPQGKIICIVPDLAGTKDAVQLPSTLAEWLDEHDQMLRDPAASHYARDMHCSTTDIRVAAAMNRHESIHVHYYDNRNCQMLLDYAVSNLGYADYVIEHTPNHKDFHFILFNR